MNFDDLLLKVNAEELRSFVRHQRQQDREFGEKFMLFFAEKDPMMDVAGKYEGMVRQIVRANSSGGFMEYRQTFSFSKEMRQVQSAAETAIERKNYRDAFAIAKAICKEVLQLVQTSDDSAGNIGGLLFSGVRIFENIAEAPTVSPELLEQLLAHLEKSLADKVWFDYGDFGYDLLEVAEKTAFRIEPGRYLNMLDSLAKIHVGPYSDYKQEDFKKRKIRFYEKMGRPEEVEKLIAANMEIVEIRREQVQKAIGKKDFARAKKLVAEGILIAKNKNHPGTVMQWEEALLEIARSENDLATVRHFSKKFAFDGRLNAKYYQVWKGTFPPEEWPQVIESHIQAILTEEKTKPRRGVRDNLEHSLYLRLSPIFVQEELWERLLQIVPIEPTEGILVEVHPYLAKRYPAEMLAFYLEMLKKLGDNASNRKEYEHLAALMKKVKQDIEGSHSAIKALAAELILKYPRRPAMLEEMRKVVGR